MIGSGIAGQGVGMGCRRREAQEQVVGLCLALGEDHIRLEARPHTIEDREVVGEEAMVVVRKPQEVRNPRWQKPRHARPAEMRAMFGVVVRAAITCFVRRLATKDTNAQKATPSGCIQWSSSSSRR